MGELLLNTTIEEIIGGADIRADDYTNLIDHINISKLENFYKLEEKFCTSFPHDLLDLTEQNLDKKELQKSFDELGLGKIIDYIEPEKLVFLADLRKLVKCMDLKKLWDGKDVDGLIKDIYMKKDIDWTDLLQKVIDCTDLSRLLDCAGLEMLWLCIDGAKFMNDIDIRGLACVVDDFTTQSDTESNIWPDKESTTHSDTESTTHLDTESIAQSDRESDAELEEFRRRIRARRRQTHKSDTGSDAKQLIRPNIQQHCRQQEPLSKTQQLIGENALLDSHCPILKLPTELLVKIYNSLSENDKICFSLTSIMFQDLSVFARISMESKVRQDHQMLHISATSFCTRPQCNGALSVGDFHGYHFEELGYYETRVKDLELASNIRDAMFSGRYKLKYCGTCRIFRYWPYAFPSEEIIEALKFNGPWSKYPAHARKLPALQGQRRRPYRPQVLEQERCLKCLEVLGKAITESEWKEYDTEICLAEKQQRYDIMKGLNVPSPRRYDTDWWIPRLASQLENLKNYERKIRHEVAGRAAQAVGGFLEAWRLKINIQP